MEFQFDPDQFEANSALSKYPFKGPRKARPATQQTQTNLDPPRSGSTVTDIDPYAFLKSFDTIFLIDDSGSMAGRSWKETAAALEAITPICTQQDTEGIDTYFLNHPDSTSYKGITQVVTIFDIACSIEGRHSEPAFGDTAAMYNFMEEDYATQKGFLIQRDNFHRVRIRQGHTVTTTGTAHVMFRFQGEEKPYPLTFHLLPKCIRKVVLGKAFLRETKTFKVLQNFTNRVKRRVVRGVSSLHLFYLGDSTPKFTGLLNGRPREALGDSGSGALIMDEDYARAMGIPIADDEEYRNTVHFADGTTAMSTGMSHGMRWEFGLGGVGKEHLLDFHILKNAPANVILSDEFLFGTNAFIEYDCYLVDEDEEVDEEEAYFFGIYVDESHKANGRPAHPSVSLTC